MKTNFEPVIKIDLQETRNKLVKYLETIPEGVRITIDRDILDDLIFLKISKKDGKLIKFPVFTGEFLRKIDISELDFSNVSFSGYVFEDIANPKELDFSNVTEPYLINLTYKDEKVDSFLLQTWDGKSFNWEPNLFNFSYTNANIVGKQMNLFMYDNTIAGSNFEGVDLSKSGFENADDIVSSNFKNTNFNFDYFINKLSFSTEDEYNAAPELKTDNDARGAWYVDFSENDFSEIVIKDTHFLNQEVCDSQRMCIDDSNFCETGLKIIKDSFPDNASEFLTSGIIDHTEEELYALHSMIESGKLNGCNLYGEKLGRIK